MRLSGCDLSRVPHLAKRVDMYQSVDANMADLYDSHHSTDTNPVCTMRKLDVGINLSNRIVYNRPAIAKVRPYRPPVRSAEYMCFSGAVCM